MKTSAGSRRIRSYKQCREKRKPPDGKLVGDEDAEYVVERHLGSSREWKDKAGDRDVVRNHGFANTGKPPSLEKTRRGQLEDKRSLL